MPSPFWPRDYGEPVTATKIAAIAGFNPVSLITGAGGFWRADAGVTQSGGNVSQWNDQSSFGNNLTKQYLTSNDSSNAVFSSTGFNTSFSGISFTAGKNVSLTAGPGNIFSSTTTASIFMLFFAALTTFSQDRMVNMQSTPAGVVFNLPSFILCTDTNALSFYAGAEQGNGGSELTATNGTIYLLGGVFDGVHSNKWLNGAVQGAASTFSSNIGDTSASLICGTPLSNGTTAAFTLAFWGITQKAMNSTDWTNLKNWCNSNWGTSF